MTQGVLIFAFNSLKFNYYDMARHSARRAKHFLNLPVTLITDTDSLPGNFNDGTWDKVITITPDKNNVRDWGQWINKGRYMAYDLSPYDENPPVNCSGGIPQNESAICNGGINLVMELEFDEP